MVPSKSNADPDPERFRELMLSDEPDFEELLECVFGITEPVAEVYHYLLTHEEHTEEELARALDCDKSSVNRKLNALRAKGLVTRHRDLLSVGGFTYEYEAVSLDEVQRLMHETLDEWAAFMHQQIDAADEALELPTQG